MEEYQVYYTLDGKRWVLAIRALNTDDAKRRLDRASAFGNVSGPWQSYPAWRGWWVPAWCWVRNRLSF